MSEKEKNNFINKNIQYKKTSSTKTGYSNSRLSGNFCTTSQPKLSFDRMTIVGNLNKHSAKKLSDFMSYEPKFRLWDILQTKFKAKALEEKVYIEYDKIKADTWDRRNMRVEFNPNNLSSDEMLWLKFNVIDYMEDDGFTRLDLAFDFEDDLNDYYVMSDKSLKKTIFYGRNGLAETKYFGVKDSDRFVRIYNKKQERKDNADIEINSEHLWRVEIELKRNMVDYWNDCFNDLHILKPDWKSIEKQKDRAMMYLLIHEEDEWGRLERHAKYKYKKLVKEISLIDLTDLMKLTLKENRNELQKQLDFWLSSSVGGKY
ncbi:replication initiation factor domain-containing protein [Staphylococcus aureus]|uniref:replication initiation factor domain-containing protein n=1 Tax=Staphylococcus aureus TaxID=1280 RepID=UPI0018EE3938|nr:replication initiation factor domain-containing protein [Staphylococcus aureus]MBJ6275965.1 replication initiation factor domain-containing protein [Staphylococcus aureus]MBJ6281254.1 replication initiation factor domain-containing protein [Staphylococcus aureus]MBJ6283967.1 replication initiation factor domain-containing protein [Staphylococcus aureus]MBJ6286686.1 replication initiation factor domain-containing protein [Staphylococcus aureus]MBJ6303346.1 replication initiation factor domai